MVEKCNSATQNWLNLTPVLVLADVPSTQSKLCKLIQPLLGQNVFGIWQYRQNICDESSAVMMLVPVNHG